MKAFIYYIYLPNEVIEKLVRNDSNNENWPRVKKYIQTLEDWQKDISKQQKIVEDYRKYLSEKKKNPKNFIIRIINGINTRLKALQARDKKGEYYLERTEEIKKEISQLKQGLDFPEYQVIKDQLKKWHNDPQASLQEVNKIFTHFSREQQEAIYQHLTDWNQKISHPVKEITEILEEWKKNNNKSDKEFEQIEEIKSLNIQLIERSKDRIIFVWWIPKIDTEIGPNRVFPNINNFFFQFEGQYYEVDHWEQTNYETVKVFANLSIFYNFYWSLIKSKVNGIFHHTPTITSGNEEVCFCPDYNIATNWHDFVCDYELKLSLFKTDKTSAIYSPTHSEESETTIPSVTSLSIHKVDPKVETLEAIEGGGETGLKAIWNNIWNAAVGTVYFTLSDRLGNNGGTNHLPRTNYKFREYLKDKAQTETVEEFLHTRYDLNNPILYHFKRLHIKATLYWRKKQIWQGNYWLIHNNLQVEEVCNASGIMIVIWANNMVITRVTESITQKVGGNALVNKFIECVVDTTLVDSKDQNSRQVERGVISDSKSGDKKIHKESKTTTSTTTKNLRSGKEKAVSGAKNLGSNALTPTLYSIDHTRSEYTTQQFETRYLISGRKPLTLRVEFSQPHLNQFRSRWELKGRPLYTYFNSDNFGTTLNQAGYLQMTVISWTMVPYADWFREKLEEGVYLYENDPKEFYEKKLTAGKNISSTSAGGTVRGSFYMVQVTTNLKTSLGRDNLVSVDNLSWVWKVSFCRPTNGGTDIFPELIRQIAQTSKLSDRTDDRAWKFDGYSNGKGEIPIPPNIEYSWYMRAFSTGDETRQNFTGHDKDGKIVLEQNGADWKLSFIGKFTIKKIVGNPENIATIPDLPNAPNDPITGTSPAFDPNTPSPLPRNVSSTFGGETEINPIDIDRTIDIDIPPLDIDPTQDIDPGTDVDHGPDIDPTDRGDND